MTNGKMIASNTHGGYFFQAEFNYEFRMMILGKEYYGSFQTGHGYYHNNYSLPTNDVSVYDDDGVLEKLDRSCGDYDDFLENSGLQISESEFLKIYEELVTLRDDAQLIVKELVAEDEAELEADTNVYIIVTPMDTDENGEIRQCGEQYSEKFEDHYEAEAAADAEREGGNLARICTKEEAYEIK